MSKPKLPRYHERKGWVGGDSRTLYAFTDARTGAIWVGPMWPNVPVGPAASVRVATGAEAIAAGWPVGWTVAEHA